VVRRGRRVKGRRWANFISMRVPGGGKVSQSENERMK